MVKGKVVPVLNQLSTTPLRSVKEWMYRSTFSWPRHYLRGEWSTSRSDRFTQGNRHTHPLDRRLGWPQSPSERCGEEKNFAPAGNWIPAFQLVDSHYTDWAISNPKFIVGWSEITSERPEYYDIASCIKFNLNLFHGFRDKVCGQTKQ
jgi:hypothetical protein